jgi:hypothetical protein
MLSHVFVAKLPNSAVSLFTLKNTAKVSAASGPVPGISPKNIPKLNPRAIF